MDLPSSPRVDKKKPLYINTIIPFFGTKLCHRCLPLNHKIVSETSNEIISFDGLMIKLAEGFVAPCIHTVLGVYIRVPMPIITVILEDSISFSVISVDLTHSRDMEFSLGTESMPNSNIIDPFYLLNPRHL